MFLSRRQLFLSGIATSIPSLQPPSASNKLAEKELILALDTSSSMFLFRNKQGVTNWDTQITGHVHALKQKEIFEKFVGRVYLRIMLWGNAQEYSTVFGALIMSPHDMLAAQTAVQGIEIACTKVGCAGTSHYTAVEGALNSRPQGDIRILDITTDGRTDSSSQARLDTLRAAFKNQAGTINALAVGMDASGQDDLQKNLCTRNGFCFSANSWADYPEALENKISTEIA
jgi:hypothetical protein